MIESLDVIFRIFRNVLRKDGIILLVENAGDDEFSKIVGIEEFTSEIKNAYVNMGFTQRKIINTLIRLPCEDVFYNVFPNKNNVKLPSLDIQHKVLILEMPAFVLRNQKNY